MLIHQEFYQHRLIQAIANYHRLQAEFIAEQLPQQQTDLSIMKDLE